jgi:trimeric autotransporter adhesin
MKNRNTITIFAKILLVLACFELLPRAEAVVPPPDGGYPGGNTAEGQNALLSLTTGTNNTAVGWFSLKTLTTGQYNTAIGSGALSVNTGDLNTATGAATLWHNTSGARNTANGFAALFSNTTGGDNTANGYQALDSNTEGDANTANGVQALESNTTGFGNTAIGAAALPHNTAGDGNTALGHLAGFNLTAGNGNVCIGAEVTGFAGESNTTRIRNIYTSMANGRAVYVNSDSKIGTLTSSRRFKEQIKPMDKASEVLFALKPISFRYKKEFDAGRAPMFGLIAEDVEQVDPDLVSRNEKGEVETVRYEQINAMLLNEFLKEHRKVEKLTKDFQATVAQQQKEIQALTAKLKEQAAQIQKVSAQVEMSNPKTKVVLKNP